LKYIRAKCAYAAGGDGKFVTFELDRGLTYSL